MDIAKTQTDSAFRAKDAPLEFYEYLTSAKEYSRRINKALAVFSLHLETWAVLRQLSRGQMIQWELAEAIGSFKVAICRWLPGLSSANYITRQEGPRDRRATNWVLTSYGKQVLCEANRAISKELAACDWQARGSTCSSSDATLARTS